MKLFQIPHYLVVRKSLKRTYMRHVLNLYRLLSYQFCQFYYHHHLIVQDFNIKFNILHSLPVFESVSDFY